MPRTATISEARKAVGPFTVEYRIEVMGPFGSDTATDAMQQSLSERIERAMNTAIRNFENDFAPQSTLTYASALSKRSSR